jgi:hypothetical protein
MDRPWCEGLDFEEPVHRSVRRNEHDSPMRSEGIHLANLLICGELADFTLMVLGLDRQ